jgi:hypothetical protein
MPTECTPTLFEFEAVERRAVVAGFDGGDITSNVTALVTQPLYYESQLAALGVEQSTRFRFTMSLRF